MIKVLRSTIVSILALVTLGCAQPYPEVPNDFESNWVSKSYTAQAFVLPTADDAFAQRIKLVRNATDYIEITYFSWDKDVLGLMLLNELKTAAENGVKVRIVIDDLLVFNEKWLAGVASQENIEIRIFNPFNSRSAGWLARAVDFSVHQKQLDNRLHQKYFNVDGQQMILGGRNIGDSYFGYSNKANFFDMDVIFSGEVINVFENKYEELWQHQLTIPIHDVISDSSAKKIKSFEKQYQKIKPAGEERIRHIEEKVASLSTPEYLNVSAIPVFDELDKTESHLPYLRIRGEQFISDYISNAKSAIISTPYLLPTDGEFTVIDQLLVAGADVTIITNSSASNDSGFVPAYYEEHRKTLLAKGVKILEYKDNAKHDDHYYDVNTNYHNKTIIIDDKITFVGSSNFDPRSDFLNMELGTFVKSEAFAQQVKKYLLKHQSEIYWRVSMDDEGGITWSDNHTSHSDEPNYSHWHRLPNRIFKHMNGESEL